MPGRYRRLFYNGPIEISDWILKVWVPRHRSLGADRQWIESNVRYSIWTPLSRNTFSASWIAYEGPNPVPVEIRASTQFRSKVIVKVRVNFIHSGRKQRLPRRT